MPANGMAPRVTSKLIVLITPSGVILNAVPRFRDPPAWVVPQRLPSLPCARVIYSGWAPSAPSSFTSVVNVCAAEKIELMAQSRQMTKKEYARFEKRIELVMEISPCMAGGGSRAGEGYTSDWRQQPTIPPAIRYNHSAMLRTQLYADPQGRFVHDLILESCRRFPGKTAIVDSSCDRRLTYAEYGEIVENLAHGLVTAGLRPGEVLAIYLPNSWEFCAAYHAATLAGAVPTLLNPTYREREVRYQLENSGAAMLVSDGPNLDGINLAGLPNLRRVYTTRHAASGAESFSALLKTSSLNFPQPGAPADQTLAALPYSSGTTGLPKGVMLSHLNLVANVFQFIGPNGTQLTHDSVVLCFLPLYHIYGLNVVLNPVLTLGATLVLMPRCNLPQVFSLITEEHPTMMPTVPPALNALCQAAEAGQFPREHHLRWVKSGAAPLAPELARRFTALTGILVCQGYGMTEASPVTHVGFLEPELYRPGSIGQPLAQTECRVIDDAGNEAATGQPGELVMRGPQFML